MTDGGVSTKIGSKGFRSNMPQLFIFISAIVLLSILNLFHNSVEIKRPVVLLAGSVFVLFDLGGDRKFSTIAKIILLYIIAMFFNQISGKFVRSGSFLIHLSLIAMLPLTVSFICSKLSQSCHAAIDTNELFKNWLIVSAIIVLHMLFLFVLLKNIYGYGYDHNFVVMASMSLYFLVFVFTWQQLESICFRRVTAIVLSTFFVVIICRGFCGI